MRAHLPPSDPAPPPSGAAYPIPMVHLPDPEPAWEYRHLSRDLRAEGPPAEEELNEMGREGWEMSGLLAADGRVHLYFKRPA